MGKTMSPQVARAPRHIVIVLNGKRTSVFPVVVDPVDDYDTILAELDAHD